MMNKVLAAMAVAALTGCGAKDVGPPADRWATHDGSRPIVIAHRGASGHRPEHTLEAYRLAIEMGADVVEPDLVLSKDGVLVARHDRYLSTTTDVDAHPEFAARKRPNNDPADAPREDWWVEDFTLAELKTLRARQPFPGRSKEFDGLYEIPTFGEVLTLVAEEARKAGRPVGVYPETKHPEFFASVGMDFEGPLLAELEGFDAGPVFIQSFEPEILQRLKGKTAAKLVQLVFAAPIIGDAGAPEPNISLVEIASYADGVGAEKRLRGFTTFDEARARSEFVEEARRLGLFVHLWTFRDDQPDPGLSQMRSERLEGRQAPADALTRLAQESASTPEFELELAFLAGVDGVFTDFPETAVRVRNRIVQPDRPDETAGQE